MEIFLITVSTVLLCSHAFAASSYLRLTHGTPLGGFSQHGILHSGFIPSGLYDTGTSLVNHGLPLGHLPGPIYGNGGYLDYAYGTGAYFGNPYGKARYLKYLYGNRLGLVNPFGGVSEAEDERSSGSGSASVLGATNGADFLSNNQNVDSTRNGIRGLRSGPIAGLGVFPSALLPHTSSVALGTYPYALGPHTSIAGFGGFHYGLQPHTPFDYLTGFPYGVGPHAPIAGLTEFHTGLGPYTSVVGQSPYLGPYADSASLGRLNTAFGQNMPNTAFRSRTSANMSSGNTRA